MKKRWGRARERERDGEGAPGMDVGAEDEAAGSRAKQRCLDGLGYRSLLPQHVHGEWSKKNFGRIK